ncbi:MAG: DUF2062 domain-containing protein [Sulfurospirillum sp.]|nr:DUF2062 domain-containing protein [Sulfurospirillum sp.]
MVRKAFKRKKTAPSKLDTFIKRYNIPREYLSVNRKMITRGLAVGIFFGFIPMPFQMLAVLAITPLLKFNVPIAITMVWLSNPFTMPFMYYMEYTTGAFLLDMDPLNVELSIHWFKQNLGLIFIPLYFGTAVYAIGFSLIVYFGVDWLWIHSVKQEKQAKDNQRRT